MLNEVLLPAMKDVGDKFGSGELILPFVLQSAEVMKKAVGHLEQFLEKTGGSTKGTVVLATVYGDVHDIGKNLVKTILANNGFTVHDLGKQVPVATIIEKAVETGADAIGLSALLVSTSKQMPFCVEELHRRNLAVPVIIGGAAINRRFAYKAHFAQDGDPYAGGVFYAKDAFEGLEVVQQLVDPARRAALKTGVLEKALANRNAPVRRAASRGPRPARAPRCGWPRRCRRRRSGAPGWCRPGRSRSPTSGRRLDLNELYKLQWGVRAKGADYERMIREEFAPKLEELKAEAQAQGWLAAAGGLRLLALPRRRRGAGDPRPGPPEGRAGPPALPAPARRAAPLPGRLLPHRAGERSLRPPGGHGGRRRLAGGRGGQRPRRLLARPLRPRPGGGGGRGAGRALAPDGQAASSGWGTTRASATAPATPPGRSSPTRRRSGGSSSRTGPSA